MEKKVLILLSVAVILSILASFLFLSSKKDYSEDKTNKAISDGKDNGNTVPSSGIGELPTIKSSNSEEGNSSGEGSGGSGGSGEGGTSETPKSTNESQEKSIIEKTCMLVRPGNIPDVTCDVNYIAKKEVSLKIKNELGEKIGIIIQLDTCDELSGEVENDNEKDFIFSCDNEDFFNQAIFISYLLEGGKKVDIGGFVRGSVS